MKLRFRTATCERGPTNSIQQLADAFCLAVKMNASGIRYLDPCYTGTRRQPMPIFDFWTFDDLPGPERKRFYDPPEIEVDMVEFGFASARCWVYDLLVASGLKGADTIVAALTVYFHLRAVVTTATGSITDPVAFASTAYDPLLEAISDLDPRAREWVVEWIGDHFTHVPEVIDYVNGLYGVEIDFYDLYDHTVSRLVQ